MINYALSIMHYELCIKKAGWLKNNHPAEKMRTIKCYSSVSIGTATILKSFWTMKLMMLRRISVSSRSASIR